MRTSTRRGRSSPRRWISPFCSARSSLACTSSGSSPTSSRNRVPPLAASKRPGRSATAPENAPLAWPNSSLSASDSGRAAQFTCTSGLARRRDSRHAVREQFLAHAGLAQQQDGQFLSPPPRRSRAAGGRWARSGPGSRGCRRARRRPGLAPRQAQRARLGLQPRGAQRRFHQHDQLAQFGLGLGAEGADLQRVQRQHAPGLALDMQAGAHAVVHRGLAGHAADQAVVGSGRVLS